MSINETPTTPSTLLEAINVLLAAIRVGALTSLVLTDMSEDAAGAKQAIDMVSREVQKQGWEWNTDEAITLTPDINGEIVLGLDILKVTIDRSFSGDQPVQRGRKLYNKTKHTFVWTTNVVVRTVVALEFADLTESMRAYVTAVAARRFCIPRLPIGATFQYTEEMVRAALASAEEENQEMHDQRLEGTSPHFDKMGRR